MRSKKKDSSLGLRTQLLQLMAGFDRRRSFKAGVAQAQISNRAVAWKQTLQALELGSFTAHITMVAM